MVSIRPISRPPITAPGSEPMPPEHRGGERLHARHEAVGEAHHAVVHQVHGAGDGGERGADDEGDRDGAVDVDAEQRRHLLVLLAGALRAAEPGLGHQVPEAASSTAVTPQMMICL